MVLVICKVSCGIVPETPIFSPHFAPSTLISKKEKPIPPDISSALLHSFPAQSELPQDGLLLHVVLVGATG